MPRTTIAAAALAAFLIPAAANAVDTRDFDVRNAGELADLCAAKPTDAKGTAASNFCHGFTQAVVDMTFTQERKSNQPRSICFPKPVPKRSATLDEFVTWVRAQPERLKTPPSEAFLRFMGERFPCSKQ
jgi:hypothetical protein